MATAAVLSAVVSDQGSFAAEHPATKGSSSTRSVDIVMRTSWRGQRLGADRITL